MASTSVNLVDAVVMNCFKSNSDNLSNLKTICGTIGSYGEVDIQSDPIRVYCNAFACFTQPRNNNLVLKQCHYKFIIMRVVAPLTEPLFGSGFLETVQHII